MDSGTQVRIGAGCIVAALGAFVVSPACGGGEPGVVPYEPVAITPLEQAVCHRLLECGCGETFAQLGLVAPLSCDGWTLADAYDDDDGVYYGYGYDDGGDDPLPVAVDEACLLSLARRIDALECDMYFTAVSEDCREFCWPFVGPRHAGEPCDDQIDCGRGLRCAFGECRDPCSIAASGEGGPCESRSDCDAATQVCTAAEDVAGVCAQLPGPGQACYYGECLPGARCVDQECRQLTPDGESCMGHRECASVYCPAGFCRPRPGPGEECGADRACATGSECVVPDAGGPGTCSADADECSATFETLAELIPTRP